jgi:hypothetical protein
MLADVIRQNEDVVAALAAALSAGDDAGAGELVARREAALAALGAALAAAGASERHGCRDRLEALVAADRDLRVTAANALARAGEAFRAQVGTAGRAPVAGGEPQTACLDRRA